MPKPHKDQQAPWPKPAPYIPLRFADLVRPEYGYDLYGFGQPPKPQTVEKKPPVPTEKRKVTAGDFSYRNTPFPSCCGAIVLHDFSLRGFSSNSQLFGTQPVDWTLPLDDGLIGEWNSWFDGVTSNLVCTTVPPSESNARNNGPEYGERYAVVEHILSRTGWQPAGKGTGAHGYPIQFWTRTRPL